MSERVLQGWVKTTINDVLSSKDLFSDGDWVESKDQDPSGNNRLIQLADIGDGTFLDKSKRFMNDEQFERLRCTELHEGDILIARMPDPIGRACLFPVQSHRCATVVDVAILRSISVDNYWLMSVVNSSWFRKEIQKNSFGTTRTRIGRNALSQIPLNLPPLPEQKKIASILTSVDAVIENTQKQIDKLQNLKKATMNELLTKGIGHTEFKDSELGRIPKSWILAEFGDYFPKPSSGMTPSRSKPEYFNGNIPWVTSGELDYNIIRGTRETISEQAVKDTNLKVYPPGTFFIAITGLEAAGTRGRCAILGIPSTVNQSCMAFPVNPNLDSSFFFQNYLLRGEEYAFKYSQGTKQQSFNAEIVKKLPILIPPLPEQKKIASILTSVDEAIDEKQKENTKLKSLKKSLMQDLLTGKVRVNIN